MRQTGESDAGKGAEENGAGISGHPNPGAKSVVHFKSKVIYRKLDKGSESAELYHN